jgi:hypothetical protein
MLVLKKSASDKKSGLMDIGLEGNIRIGREGEAVTASLPSMALHLRTH